MDPEPPTGVGAQGSGGGIYGSGTVSVINGAVVAHNAAQTVRALRWGLGAEKKGGRRKGVRGGSGFLRAGVCFALTCSQPQRLLLRPVAC